MGAKLAITAADEVTITVGMASLTMKKDGTIELKGMDVTVDAAMKLLLKGGLEATMSVGGSLVKANPAMVETSAPMVKSTASAMNEITGATVKLN